MTDVATPVAPTPTPVAASDAKGNEAKAPPQDATPVEKKIWKLKADGQEFEFDASDEAALKKEVEKARGAGKRFEEAAKMRRQAEQFIEMLKTNPRAVLENPKLGIDLRKFSEEYLWEQMQEEQLTPEQKRQRDIERELQKYKEQELTAKQAADEKERLELQAHYEGDFERKILAALEQGNVPKNRETVRRMAHYMRIAIENDLNIEPSDLISRVRKDYSDALRELTSSAEGDVLISIVGEEMAKKIREADLKRLKSTQKNQFQTPAPKSQPSSPNVRVRKLTGQDWRKQLMQEAGIARPKK